MTTQPTMTFSAGNP